MKFFTKVLSSGTFTILGASGAQMLSVQANASSECTFTGGIPFQGELSEPITLSNGEITTVSAASPSSPIDGITVEWVSGTIDIIIGL